jgi:dihydrolipoamide dehydrogenase
MVSDYTDAGQERWLADNGIDLLRGTGRLAGPGASRSTACATPPTTSSWPTAPIRRAARPGLRELDGVWTNREATAMKAVPRRLLILGGGPSASSWRRRSGGSAASRVSSTRPTTCSARAAPLGEALGEVLRARASSSSCRPRTAARRDGDDYVLELDDGRELRGDRLLVATGRRPRVSGVGLETVGVEPDAHGVPVDAHLRAGERLWAIGDVTASGR